MKAGELDQLVTIERPIAADDFDGAGSGTWVPVAKAWAKVQDVTLARRGQLELSSGFPMSTRLTRILIRYQEGVTMGMRFVLGDRIMQIVSGPVVIGRNDGMEFMVEEYQPAGNPA